MPLNADRRSTYKGPTGLFPEDRAQQQEFGTKLALISFFWAVFISIVSREPFRKKRIKVSSIDLVMLSISTFRLGRLIAFDRITEPLRYPFTQTVQDETGAGATVEPRGTGMRKAFGELISCPICAGTWVSAALVYAIHLLPGPTRVFLTIMSSIGTAELLNSLAESFSWIGQAARRASGNQHDQ
jgi:hypothetical protein